MEWEGSWRPVVAEETEMNDVLKQMRSLSEKKAELAKAEDELKNLRAKLYAMPVDESRTELASMVFDALGRKSPSEAQIEAVLDILALEGVLSFRAGANAERSKRPAAKKPEPSQNAIDTASAIDAPVATVEAPF
jgi:hypothetical protein